MAKLLVLPEKSIIKGFKGTLDYYVHLGQPCCRSWPGWYLTERSPAVQAAESTFASAVAATKLVSPVVRAAALAMSRGTKQTWKDVLMSGMLGGLYE